MSDNVLLSENPALYFKQKREQAIAEAPDLIDSGHSLIYPELYEEWDRVVNSNVRSLYHGAEVKEALKIMKALDMGASIEEVKLIFEKIDGAGVKALAANIVRDFDKKGPEFWLAVNPGKISDENLRTLTNVQIRNKAIEGNKNSKQTSNHK